MGGCSGDSGGKEAVKERKEPFTLQWASRNACVVGDGGS